MIRGASGLRWRRAALLGLLLPAPTAAQQPRLHCGPWAVAGGTHDGTQRWRPAGSAVRPLILLVTNGNGEAADTLFARYLASQGYDVLRAGGSPSRLSSLLQRLATPGQSAAGVAVLGSGSGAQVAGVIARRVAAVRALVEIEPAAGSPPLPPRISLLRFRRPGSSQTVTPPGTERLVVVTPSNGRPHHAGVTHAFLDRVLRGLGEPLPVLAQRLQRAGLQAGASDAVRREPAPQTRRVLRTAARQ